MKSVCGFSRSAVCPLTIALQNIFPWLRENKDDISPPPFSAI